MKIIKLTILLVLIGTINTCGPYQHQNEMTAKFVVGFKRYLPKGHEILTAYGINQANIALGDNMMGDHFYPRAGDSLSTIDTGYESFHPVIRGNYLTDRPIDKREGELNLAAYLNININDNTKDWHNVEVSQRFHFLRKNNPPQTAKSACQDSVAEIGKLSHLALEKFGENPNLAFNFIGVATHIIQDSYSSAHTTRLPLNNYRIDEVCNWGDSRLYVCNHTLLEAMSKDLVFDASSGNEGASVIATRDYLVLVAQAITKDTHLDQGLSRFFDTFINCQNIPKNGFEENVVIQDGMYSGFFQHNLPQGQGSLTMNNGNVCVGNFDKGQMSGKGKITKPNGAFYVGDVVNCKRSGHGVMTWPDGSNFEGEWSGDLPNGQGIQKWADGSRYVGEWKDGNREGKGILYAASGGIYEGEWKNDEYHGYGKYTTPDKSTVLEGRWENSDFKGS